MRAHSRAKRRAVLNVHLGDKQQFASKTMLSPTIFFRMPVVRIHLLIAKMPWNKVLSNGTFVSGVFEILKEESKGGC